MFRKNGFNQIISLVYNIPKCVDLSVLDMTFQENCQYTLHIVNILHKAELFKANKCLYFIKSFGKEGACQDEVHKLFSGLVLSTLTYSFSV